MDQKMGIFAKPLFYLSQTFTILVKIQLFKKSVRDSFSINGTGKIPEDSYLR